MWAKLAQTVDLLSVMPFKSLSAMGMHGLLLFSKHVPNWRFALCAKTACLFFLGWGDTLHIWKLQSSGIMDAQPWPLRKAHNLMPRYIMPSQPRHWMVFCQLVMIVHSCAEAMLGRRVGNIHLRYVFKQCTSGKKHVREFGSISVDTSLAGTLGQHIFKVLVPDCWWHVIFCLVALFLPLVSAKSHWTTCTQSRTKCVNSARSRHSRKWGCSNPCGKTLQWKRCA